MDNALVLEGELTATSFLNIDDLNASNSAAFDQSSTFLGQVTHLFRRGLYANLLHYDLHMHVRKKLPLATTPLHAL